MTPDATAPAEPTPRSRTASPGSMPARAERPAPRQRRGKRDHSRPRSAICRREGCGRPVEMPDRSFCTGLCRLIERQQESAQRICQSIGPSPAASELWASVVELSDAMTRHLTADSELRVAARSVGIDDERWQAIKDGRQHSP